jgi:autotransporter-associated beta strand protein
MDTGNLTVTGANGYGLTFGALTTFNTSTVTNNAPGELRIDSLGVSGGSSSPAMTFGGTGTTRITGAINSGAFTIFGIAKTGPGTLRFGTSVDGFARAAVVNDGTLDLNGLTYNVNALTMGGAASVLGAQLVTGASGSLALGGTLTFTSAASQAGAVFTGNLGLGAASRSFVINDNTTLPVDLTISGPITGSPGAAIDKSGAGTLRFTGAGNTQPGLVTVSAGVLELAKSSGDGIGTGGLNVFTNGSVIRLVSGEQIHNSAPVSIGNSGFLELSDFTETTGPVTFTQTTPNQYGAIKTGSNGTLVLNGNLTFNNNTNTLATTSERNVLITGTGTKSVATTTGTLDLGGAVRTIHVTSNGPSTNANATIETRVINGGILKTGPRTLFLNHPDNTFAGGLQISQGFVRPGTGTSLGLGPITFSNAPGVAAGIDFGGVTGILANEITTAGGESGFTYSALAPSSLVLSGAFNLAGEIVFNVVDGTVIKGSSAILDVTGTVTDGAGTFGLRKQGNGTLKLAAGNTYGGGTIIEKGILAIAAGSALGDSTAPLTIDGGSLASSGSLVLARDVVIGTNGGNLRADDISHTLELTGSLTWSPGTTTVDGPGRTVLSGSTSGPGGNLVLGAPIAFATGTTTSTSWNSRFCLQGTAALAAGNLSIVNGAVLELGNSNFTRALGTGLGEVQLPTSQGAGWAAVGANRAVNLGGLGATLVWGQGTFLNNPSTGTGPLILGSISGTHTLEFQNPVRLTEGTFGVSRTLITQNGPAAVDARITGDLGEAGSTLSNNLIFNSFGTLEIAGNIRGNIGVTHSAAGRTILSGTNDIVRQLRVTQGTLEFANNASLGTPQFIEIQAGATLDASALTVPVTTTSSTTQTVNGVLDGDFVARGFLVGNGEVTGDLSATAPFTNFEPTLGGTFRVGGDMSFAADTQISFLVNDVTPETGYNRIQVTGAVNLSGNGAFFANFSDIPEDFSGTLFFILNDGTDPINGTFAGYQENDLVPLGDGRSLQITYLANGDGGAVGNDFGATVVGTSSATDLSLTAVATAAVAPLGVFNVVYSVENIGLNPAFNPFVRIQRPFNATFAPPYPANSAFFDPFQNELFVAIDSPLAAGATAPGFTVYFTAPGTTDSVSVEANVESSSFDLNSGNDFYGTTTAVLPGGAPVISVYDVNTVSGTVQVGVDTIFGIEYVFQRSLDLEDWENVFPPFFGSGSPILVNEDIDETKEFFRFGIVPQGGNFGGGGGGE